MPASPCTAPTPPALHTLPYTTLFRSRGGKQAADRLAPSMRSEEAGRIRTHPEERRVPQGNDARVSQNQIERDGEQADDQNLAAQHQRSEEHTSELQSPVHLVCRLLPAPPRPPPRSTLFPTRRSSDLAAASRPLIGSPHPCAARRPAVYAPTPKNAACPRETMPAYPKIKSSVTANKPTIRIWLPSTRDRKSTRLNSSHPSISYAGFSLHRPDPPRAPHSSLHDALPISRRQAGR